MKITLKKEWMGHKAGSNLNIKDDYANNLVRRGVAERSKAILKSDNDKQVKIEKTK